jgi:hypothetical protein
LTRSAGASVVAALLAVALGGCGASGDQTQQVSRAVSRTLAVQWARYEIALQRPTLFASPIAVLGGRAANDFRTGRDYAFIQLRLGTGSYQTIFIDVEPTMLLLSPSPAPAGALPADAGWISVRLIGRGAERSVAAQAEGLTPVLALEEVRWGALSVSSLGGQVLENVPMDEYRVSVSLARALSAARSAGRAAIAAAIGQELAASQSGRVSILVWVSGPGYVGKIAAAVPGSGLGSASFWFLSYTKPYTGTAPPSAQVASLASLAHNRRSPWAIVTGS